MYIQYVDSVGGAEVEVNVKHRVTHGPKDSAAFRRMKEGKVPAGLKM